MSRTLRRLGIILAVVVALAGPAIPPAVAAPSQVIPDDAGASPSLRLIDQTREVTSDGDFSVLVTAGGIPEGGDLAVDIFDRITTDAELQQSATLDPANERDRFDPLPLAATSDGPTAAAFTIHLHDAGPPRPGTGAWAYRLTEPGVYPIRLRLRGPDGTVLTSLVTYLVRTPSADEPAAEPMPIALLAFLQAPVAPDLKVGEPIDDDQRKAFDQTLGAFADHPGLPATFAVTPDTAARLATDPSGSDTLDALIGAVTSPRRELLGAPYTDIDPAALVGSGLTDELRRQIDLGRRTLRDTVNRSGTATWWLADPLDDPTIDELHAAGVNQLVVDPSVLAGNRPTQPLQLVGSTEADQIAVTVTGPVEVPAGPTDDPVLVVQQLLGRLAANASTGSAAVMTIDPMTIDPDVLALLLEEIEQPDTYLAPSTVSRVFDVATDATATPVQPAPPDLGTYPDQLRGTRALAANYGSMLADPSRLDDELDRRLALTASQEASPAARRRLLGTVDAELESRFSVVSMTATERVTLGARDATFPLTIRSDATVPLEVVITLQSSDRLGLPQDRIDATLQPGRTIVSVPVQTRTSGDTPLFITVTTPDGQIVLADSRYTIRSTAVSGVGLLLTVGAAAFLAAWWARHWHRTAKERKRAAAIAEALGDDQVDDDHMDDDHMDDEPLFVDEPPARPAHVTDPAAPGSDPD